MLNCLIRVLFGYPAGERCLILFRYIYLKITESLNKVNARNFLSVSFS